MMRRSGDADADDDDESVGEMIRVVFTKSWSDELSTCERILAKEAECVRPTWRNRLRSNLASLVTSN
jgi:chromosome condensin MukBEF complex kleisin-like MukF subunit